ncbi:uncharacterized protein [Venturia canescens]|uniref:uncharacterized protein n=1 Tax=Venturia canescens TaxID=32260 RepID=UPI001C9CC2CF|nr:uncharacterized protein LOC122415829 [Venturia canescens]
MKFSCYLMRMNGIDIDLLSLLSELVDKTLYSTEEVKQILEIECNNARSVLRTCPIDIVITREIDEHDTRDVKSSLTDHAQEIVDGIGKALAQAQELREKTANNISKQRRKAREPDVKTIYTAYKNNVQKKSKPIGHEKISPKPMNSRINKTFAPREQLDVKKNEVMGKRSSELGPKTAAEKTPVRISNSTRSSSNTEKAKTKNFLAANKANLKNIKRHEKSTSDPKLATNCPQRAENLSPLSGTSEILSSCTTSIAQLNDLMRKVSTEATEVSSALRLDTASASRIVTEKVRSMIDLMEGLDRFGVPSNLVRVLKVYHAYVNKEVADDRNHEQRCQRATAKFLSEFHAMNENRVAEQKTYAELEPLLAGFTTLQRSLHAQSDFSDEDTNEIISRYAALDFAGKSIRLRKFDPAKFRKSRKSGCLEKDAKLSRSWSAHGVWNRFGPDCFPNTMGLTCIRYSNKTELSSFFKLNQRLQLCSYQKSLLDLLVEKILPSLDKHLDGSSSQYCEVYKIIFTIAQVINPRIPTLVRTDA